MRRTRCSTCRWITATELRTLRLRQVGHADQLGGEANRGQRVAQLVGQRREELVLPAAGFLQLRGSLGDPRLESAVQPFELPRLAVQLDEDPDLRAQNLGHDRHRHVVDGAILIALQSIELGERDARDEDDGRLAEPRVLAHHRGQLESVELGHDDVDQDDRELGLEQVLERFAAGSRGHQRRIDAAQNRAVGQQLGRLIVDQQDADVVAQRRGGVHVSILYRCSHMRNADSSCSVLTGLAR